MLEFVRGDIFDVPADIRVNTVNCVGVMGAGVALAFKQRYPDMFKDYKRDCKDGLVKPGMMHVWKSLSGDWIINFPTKRDWRDPSRYEDIEAGLNDLRHYLDRVGPVTVALPALGCGHGGLDWGRVSEMIRDKLCDASAHIFVFEPSASRQAGRAAAEKPTDAERKAAEQLGYKLIERDVLLSIEVPSPIYVLGKSELLSRKWIGLLPSRSPGEREMQALRAIAVELARTSTSKVVALVHGTRASEDVAGIFLSQGIDIVLLLPFGVLTRKTLAKQVDRKGFGSLTLASTAPANGKWSHQLFAQTMDMLRANAAAMLVSDPEPDWITRTGASKWAQTPISYVRYETTPQHIHEALAAVSAWPIKRRGEDGTPNIDHLIRTYVGHLAEVDAQKLDTHTSILRQPLIPTELEKSQDEEDFIQIPLNSIPEISRRDLLDLVRQLDAANITISVKLSPTLTEADRKKIKEFSSSQN